MAHGCARCGAWNADGAAFCAGCGTPLPPAPAARATGAATVAPPTGPITATYGPPETVLLSGAHTVTRRVGVAPDAPRTVAPPVPTGPVAGSVAGSVAVPNGRAGTGSARGYWTRLLGGGRVPRAANALPDSEPP